MACSHGVYNLRGKGEPQISGMARASMNGMKLSNEAPSAGRLSRSEGGWGRAGHLDSQLSALSAGPAMSLSPEGRKPLQPAQEALTWGARQVHASARGNARCLSGLGGSQAAVQAAHRVRVSVRQRISAWRRGGGLDAFLSSWASSGFAAGEEE